MMKIACFLGLLGSAAASCTSEIEAIATEANLNKIMKLLPQFNHEALMSDYCTNDAADINEIIDTVAEACFDEAQGMGIRVQEVAAVLRIVQVLPCIPNPSGFGFAWTRFAKIVPLDTLYIALAADPAAGLINFRLDFSPRMTRSILAEVCDDGGEAFRVSTDKIVRQLGLPGLYRQLGAAVANLSDNQVSLAEDYIKIFKRYGAQLANSCARPKPDDPPSDYNEFCRVRFNKEFNVTTERPLGMVPATGTDFCGITGRPDPCTQEILAGTQSFPGAEDNNNGSPIGDEVIRRCKPEIDTTVTEVGYEITAKIKVDNIKGFTEALAEFLPMAAAYDFGFLTDYMEVTDWTQGTNTLSFTVVITVRDAEEGLLERLQAKIVKLLARMEADEFVLPQLEALAANFKNDPAAPITVDYASSSIKVVKIGGKLSSAPRTAAAAAGVATTLALLC